MGLSFISVIAFQASFADEPSDQETLEKVNHAYGCAVYEERDQEQDVELDITAAVEKMILGSAESDVVIIPEQEHTGISFSPEESDLLTRIAMAEAENQDTEGKALVMCVVLNRAKGGNEFPDTVRDVIYQPKQFSPVLEGKFERTVADSDCWRALEMVSQGWDESMGALYFESDSVSTWHMDHLKYLFKHEDHAFYTDEGDL